MTWFSGDLPVSWDRKGCLSGEILYSRGVSFGATSAARVKTLVTSPTRASLPCLPADWSETNCRGYRRVMQNPVKSRNPKEGKSPEGSWRRLFNFAARQTLPCFAWAKPGMDRRRVGIPSHIYGRDPARVALMVAGTETQTRRGIGHGEAYGPEDRFAALDAYAQSG